VQTTTTAGPIKVRAWSPGIGESEIVLASKPSSILLLGGLGTHEITNRKQVNTLQNRPQVQKKHSEVIKENQKLKKEISELNLKIVNLNQVIFDMQQKGAEKPDNP